MSWLKSRGAPLTLALILTALIGSGCRALPYFLMLAPEPTIAPEISLFANKREKKRAMVISYADSGIRFGYESIDDDLTDLLLAELVRNEERLEIIPARKVREWKDRNQGWVEKSLQDIGEHHDVDYVIFLEAQDFSLNETKNQYLLQGRARVLFRVHDVAKDVTIFERTYDRDYPPNRPVPVTEVASEEQFKRRFLMTMARELSWFLVPHRQADQVSDL